MDVKRANADDLEAIAWAEKVAAEACAHYGVKRIPEFTWRLAWQSAQYRYLRDENGQYLRDRWGQVKRKQTNSDVRRYGTSGTWNFIGISIKLGHHETDKRYVILHEIAHHIHHHIETVGRKDAHNKVFWKLNYDLCEMFGVDLEHAYRRGRKYKFKAATRAERERTGI